MVQLIYHQFYARPLWQIIVYMILLIFVWNLLEYCIRKRYNKETIWKMINVFLMFGMIGVVLIVTLSNRGNADYEIILIPFHSFLEAKIQPEMYRSMLMNVFLFFPLGLSLPFVLPEKWKHQVLWSILFAMLLSIGIEFLQYYYHLGRAEVDDVLCNTLGCAIGCTSYLLYKRLFLLKNMFRKRR